MVNVDSGRSGADLQAVDPVPCPERVSAFPSSGQGTGSTACKSAPERPESTLTIAKYLALSPSIQLARRMQRRYMPTQRDAAWHGEPCPEEGREPTPTLRDDYGLRLAVAIGFVTETYWLVP